MKIHGHLTWYSPITGKRFIISNHKSKEVASGTLKTILKDAGIPIVDYVWFYDYEYLNDKDKYLNSIKKIGYPVVVKPASLGSSIGINYVKSDSDIDKYIEEAISYDNKIIVEKAVNNLIEVNCSVLGNYEQQEASILEQVISSNSILTFSDKYVGNGKSKKTSKGGMVNTSRIIPANIDESITEEIKKESKKVFKLLNLAGVCRIDYLIDSKTKEFYVNEPNTIPGSLSFYLWEPLGKDYKTLLDEIIRIGIRNYKNKDKKTTIFDTNILSDYKSKAIKK